MFSGPELLHLPHGASILAENVMVRHLDVALLAVVVVLHLLDEVVVVTTLPVRTIAETETEITIVENVVETGHAAPMTGKMGLCTNRRLLILTERIRDRDVKDERDRDEVRENGTNGEDRKGEFELPSRVKN